MTRKRPCGGTVYTENLKFFPRKGLSVRIRPGAQVAINYRKEQSVKVKDKKEAFRNFFSLYKEDPKQMLEILESFKDGYDSGYQWPDAWNYRPGGPWVFSCRGHHLNSSRCEFCEKAELSSIKHNAWMTGWDIGNTQKIKEGRHVSVPTKEEIDEFNSRNTECR